MKLKYLSLVGLSLIGFQLTAVTQNASAAEASTAEKATPVNSYEGLTSDKIQKIDDYVKVKNNSFVLETANIAGVSSQDLNLARQEIDSVNSSIKSKGLIIDPETKEVIQYNPYMVLVKGATKIRSGLEVKWFWWGQRSYFSSNAAVSYTVNKYRNHSDVLGILEHVTKYKIATVGTIYYTGLANNLESYNKKHKHSKIYMDINWAFVPSFGTWK